MFQHSRKALLKNTGREGELNALIHQSRIKQPENEKKNISFLPIWYS